MFADESLSKTDTAEHTSRAEHLDNSPVTKISPSNGPFPDGADAEFKRICGGIKGLPIVSKKEIIWSKKDPLHFWQSLAFTLRGEELTSVAVSSFVDTQGQNRLYIASNNPMTPFQQQEVTDIINMFLDLNPADEIAAKLIPRHLPYIIKQFPKMWPSCGRIYQGVSRAIRRESGRVVGAFTKLISR